MSTSISVPWFIVDIESFDVITLPNVPLNVTSSKNINYAKKGVPGDETQPMQFTGMGPKTISFDIDVIKKSQTLGALPVIKQFESLRVPQFGLGNLIFGGSNRNPKVLFHYLAGDLLPLEYYVTKCDLTNSLPNFAGYPQRCEVSMELTLDEKSVLYTSEKMARVALKALGAVEGVDSLIRSAAGSSPYQAII